MYESTELFRKFICFGVAGLPYGGDVDSEYSAKVGKPRFGGRGKGRAKYKRVKWRQSVDGGNLNIQQSEGLGWVRGGW